VFAIMGVLAGLLLLVISWIDPTGFRAIRSLSGEVTAPVSRGLTEGRVGAKTFWEEVTAYFDAASKNARLKREVEASRAKLIEARALEQENERLRKMLKLVEEKQDAIAVARLINSSASSTRRIATLGAGRLSGVMQGQPVRSPRGLVGRVLSSGPSISRVLLVTDPQTVVPVRRASDGVVAFSQGRGDGRVDIRLINVGINPFKKGDILVTSGNGGLYQPGIPVAVVDVLTSDGAIANILSDPAETDFVMVFPAYQPELTRIEEQERAGATEGDDRGGNGGQGAAGGNAGGVP